MASALGRRPSSVARDFLFPYFPPGSRGAEIGIWKGDFTHRILKQARPGEFHLIDPWQHQPGHTYRHAWYGGKAEGQDAMDAIHASVRRRFRRPIAQGQIVIHRAPSVEAAADFDDGSLDWVYVDGDHTYDAVRADLHAYLPKIRPGGILSGDDYGDGGWWEGGVKKAVDEFVAEGRAELLLQQGTQYVMRVPDA